MGIGYLDWAHCCPAFPVIIVLILMDRTKRRSKLSNFYENYILLKLEINGNVAIFERATECIHVEPQPERMFYL